MPNWCENEWEILADDEEQAEEIAELLKAGPENAGDGVTFEKLIPLPEQGWEYDWAVRTWGTKWDASDGIIEVLGETVMISFYSAWGPPEGVANELRERYPDVSMSMFYREPGMQFAGYL